MATFAIGDIHGKYDCLQRLLQQIQFDIQCDRLWCTGDLINRGKQSLEVLRFCRQLDQHLIVTLGNHDVSLLASYHGYRKDKKLNKTTQKILAAKDIDHLIQWLQCRPFLHFDALLNCILVHAAIPAALPLATLLQHVQQLQQFFISSPHVGNFLQHHLMGNKPKQWHEAENDYQRYRFLINSLTRQRYVKHDGSLSFKEKQRPPVANRRAWYEQPHPILAKHRIIFGHWATLAYHPNIPTNALHIDTACALRR